MQKPENCLQIESEMRAHFNKTYATLAEDPVLLLVGLPRGTRGVVALLANNSCTILGDLMKEVQTKPQSQLQPELCVGQGKGHKAARGLRPHMHECVCVLECVRKVHTKFAKMCKRHSTLPARSPTATVPPLPISPSASACAAAALQTLLCLCLSACCLLLGGELNILWPATIK